MRKANAHDGGLSYAKQLDSEENEVQLPRAWSEFNLARAKKVEVDLKSVRSLKSSDIISWTSVSIDYETALNGGSENIHLSTQILRFPILRWIYVTEAVRSVFLLRSDLSRSE